MLPIAVTGSPRSAAAAAAVLLAWWLAPPTALGPAIGIVVLSAMTALGTGVAFAHAVGLRAVAHEGDWLELRDGERARVRTVRLWYTVADTFDGTTVLIPNANIRERSVRPPSS